MKVLRKQGRILKGFLIASLTMTSNAFSAELEEIVVTARATEESVREVPVAITAVSEERMDRYGIEGFMDLEAMTPQLTIGRGGSGSGASCPSACPRSSRSPAAASCAPPRRLGTVRCTSTSASCPPIARRRSRQSRASRSSCSSRT